MCSEGRVIAVCVWTQKLRMLASFSSKEESKSATVPKSEIESAVSKPGKKKEAGPERVKKKGSTPVETRTKKKDAHRSDTKTSKPKNLKAVQPSEDTSSSSSDLSSYSEMDTTEVSESSAEGRGSERGLNR